tara:strand:- start:496 stop:627 length:132 start_codon:yes stop_codon:yes gene_type:complete
MLKGFENNLRFRDSYKLANYILKAGFITCQNSYIHDPGALFSQ